MSEEQVPTDMLDIEGLVPIVYERSDPENEHLRATIEVCEFLLANPEVPVPFSLRSGHVFYIEDTVLGQAADQRAELARIARALGRCDKVTQFERFGVERVFGRSSLRYLAERVATCRPKVIGTKTVRKSVLVTPAKYATVNVQVDDVEWECEPLLAAATEGEPELEFEPGVPGTETDTAHDLLDESRVIEGEDEGFSMHDYGDR